MVRLRLRRVGLKGQPSYRIIAADKEAPRDGRFLEILGFYNPRTEPATVEVKEDRVYDCMNKGAQPSESTLRVFKMIGLMDRYERLKKGESLETLLAEAQAAASARQVDPRTRRETPVKKASKAEAKE